MSKRLLAFPVAIATLALAGLLARGASAADAAPASTARSVEIEVTEAAGTQPATTSRITLAILFDGSPSEIYTRIGDASYKIKARVDHTGGAVGNALHVSFHRSSPGAARLPDVDLNTTHMVETGRRTVIAKVDRAEGSRTEVAALVR
jgi:hypothetical protein